MSKVSEFLKFQSSPALAVRSSPKALLGHHVGRDVSILAGLHSPAQLQLDEGRVQEPHEKQRRRHEEGSHHPDGPPRNSTRAPSSFSDYRHGSSSRTTMAKAVAAESKWLTTPCSPPAGRLL